MSEELWEMMDKILQWKFKEGRMNSAFKEGTPQEIIDLEKEYRKRTEGIMEQPFYHFIIHEK